MVDILGYFFFAFFIFWGVAILVNTRETADTVPLRIVSISIAMFMFAVSGLVLNAII